MEAGKHLMTCEVRWSTWRGIYLYKNICIDLEKKYEIAVLGKGMFCLNERRLSKNFKDGIVNYWNMRVSKDEEGLRCALTNEDREWLAVTFILWWEDYVRRN